MAESARQPYDDEASEQSAPKPDLEALEGGGEPSGPPRGQLKDADKMSPEELEQSEANGASDGGGQTSPEEQDQFFNASDKPSRRGRLKAARGLLKKRKQLLIGGVIASLAGGLVSIILFFLPSLRLESYMQRINQRAFAFATNAIEARTGHLFERYMINHIINLERCKAVRSIDCKVAYNKGIASNLFNTWRDVRIEEKIFDRLGFSIESRDNPNPSEGVHRFTIKDRRGNLITFENEKKWDTFKSGQFEGGSREIGRELRQAIKQETRLLNVMERRSVRKYLTRKHGINLWCFFACKTRDNVDIKLTTAVAKYKYRFVEKFITPFSAKYGFIMNCLINGDSCKPSDAKKHGIDTSQIPDTDLEFIENHFDGKPNARLSSYVIEKILTKIIGEQVAKKAVGLVPIAGQIYLGIVVVDMLDRADSFVANNGLSKLAADLNAKQYLVYYSGMHSLNDEMKSHALSLDKVGAAMSDFEGAEESLVYQAYNTPTATASLFGNKAYAQASQPDTKEPYVCANGDPIPAGELVCNEKKVSRTYKIEEIRGNKFVGGIFEGVFQLYRGLCVPGSDTCLGPRVVVRGLLTVIDSTLDATLGKISSGLLGLVQKIPGVGDFLAFILEKTKDLFLAFFEKVFPLPVSPDSPGREKYDGLEAGADVAASEFGKGGYTDSDESYGLGARVLTDAETLAINQDHLEQHDYEYQNSSLMAKLTNLERPNSFANNLLAVVPSSFSQIPGRFASSLSSFFTNIFSFGFWNGFFGNSPVYAQSFAQRQSAVNAFGVTRYGYPLDDPSITDDPEKLTPEYCQKAKEARLALMAENPVTGFDEYSVADPCLLEEAVVEAAGAWFTDD